MQDAVSHPARQMVSAGRQKRARVRGVVRCRTVLVFLGLLLSERTHEHEEERGEFDGRSAKGLMDGKAKYSC